MPFSVPESLRSEYPFLSRSLDLDGVRYHYIDEGSGDPVLFVHGNPSWSFAWRRFIPAVTGTHRAIAVDHVGMGLSDKPVDYPYRLAQHIDNLVQLIRELDLRRITLVGHDWGGCIGMGAAVREPQRFSQFCMLNTAAFRSRRIPLRIAVCRIPWLGAFGVQGLNLFARAALSMATAKPERMTPSVCRGYLLPYDSWNHRLAVQRFVEDIPLDERHPSYATLTAIENGLAQFRERHWLLAWGEQDWCFTPDFLEEWVRRFPEARVVRIPSAGHYVFEDAHELVIPELKQLLLTDKETYEDS